MRTFTFCLIFLVAASLPLTLHASELIKVASWNIANLHHEPGVPLRFEGVQRDEIDYQRLRQVVEDLDADILALQEIGSPAALGRIVPEEHYHLIVSGRYQQGNESLPPQQRDIFVALAISKKNLPPNSQGSNPGRAVGLAPGPAQWETGGAKDAGCDGRRIRIGRTPGHIACCAPQIVFSRMAPVSSRR